MHLQLSEFKWMFIYQVREACIIMPCNTSEKWICILCLAVQSLKNKDYDDDDDDI